MKGYIPVAGYVHVEPMYDMGALVGARLTRVTLKPPKHGRSVHVVFHIPSDVFEPLETAPQKVDFTAALEPIDVEVSGD